MASKSTYLSVVVGLETMVFAGMQLMIETQAPEFVLEKIRAQAPMLLSTSAQLFLSILMALFLFAMNGFGIAMGIIVLLTVGVNAYTINAYPDAMPRYGMERVPDGDDFQQNPYGQKQFEPYGVPPQPYNNLPPSGGPPSGVAVPPPQQQQFDASQQHHQQLPIAQQAPSTADL